jgi:membrane-bound inhibitor of C-type lysozyme
MKNKKILNIFLSGLLLILIINGCRKEIDTYKKVNPGQTATYPLNGEYFVMIDLATIIGADTTWTIDPFGLGHNKIMLYNTASNRSDSIWVDDLGNIWNFKVKATCNPTARTFSIIKGQDIMLGDTTTIKNGQLILNKGITKSGNKTDSICMIIHWASDASIYRLSGVRRTGFQADEPPY